MSERYTFQTFEERYEKECAFIRADERARVIEELFNLSCKNISIDECDAYRGNCFHCQLDRIKQKAEQLKTTKTIIKEFDYECNSHFISCDSSIYSIKN